MSLDQATAVLRTHLLSGADFEIAGSDHATGVGYRVTVRHGDIDLAPFSIIAPAPLQTSIEAELPVSIGATLYRVERSFGPDFLRTVREGGRAFAISITVQSHRQIVCVLGREVPPLLVALEACVPSMVKWDPDTLVEGSREWGRKVGHAAKDLAGLREVSFGLEHLETLERSGEAEAYEAVRKEAVWPAPTVEVLRAQGVPPVVAFGIVSCWRMLRQRPARGPAFRLAFVRDLPSFRAALEMCRTLDDFGTAVATHLSKFDDATAIFGPRLPSFVQRLSSQHRTFYAHSDAVLRDILAIDGAAGEVQWSLVARALSVKAADRCPPDLPLPARLSWPLEQLTRSGLALPSPPPLDRISADLGITGLELGNYVSRQGGERLARRLAEAFADLRCLLGDWIVHLCRTGNLSVALGARGKGKACAHYEPALRVINLTKSRGDGSLAHEFAHFLDHMIASSAAGESRYLSARVVRLQRADHPVAMAMSRVMQAASVSSRRERVTGDVEPNRWFLRGWMAKHGYDPQVPPQVSFDRVADAVPDRFRGGRDPRSNSVILVNSLAKFTKSPAEVEISYDGKSNFIRAAKALGVYWSRPEELFARAFESFVEDEAAKRGWTSQYLVFGTQRDYSDCRALPYPVGAERERIASAMCELVTACASEQKEGAILPSCLFSG